MTPTISVPLPVLQHILALTRVAGENTKGKIADEVQGLIDGYTKELESQIALKEGEQK